MWVGAGIVTWFFMMGSLYTWWGGLGILGGIILAPGVILFPFLYWLMEGAFPIMYFGVWAVGILGLIIASFSVVPRKDGLIS